MFFLVAAASACSAHPKSPDPGPTCEQAAQHLVDLSLRDNDATQEPDEMVGVKPMFERQCVNDEWSKARRQCVLDAETQEATLDCDKL